MVQILAIICHSNGQFSVSRNLGGGNGISVFSTREEAEARAKHLQEEAGGPVKARIDIRDLTTVS